MRVRRVLKSGKPGTKKLVKRYGKTMLCVRYRYDEDKMMIYKTVEIIVDEKPWQKKAPKKSKKMESRKPKAGRPRKVARP